MLPIVSKPMRKFLAAIVLCGLPSISFSGADNTTRYFMDNSPSLLDFGIHRMEVLLNARLTESVRVFYDWDEDEIQIHLLRFDIDGFSESECRDQIATIRNGAGYSDGELRESYDGRSYFASLFTHSGYVTGEPEESKTKLQNLEKKFVIQCHTSNKQFSAKLQGTQIAVTEIE